MRKCFKVLFISSVLVLTSACQETLDTSSNQAKEQSVKQMMVGIYPQNQKIFKRALKDIYLNDQKRYVNLSKMDANSLTDERLKGKTVEEVLQLSFSSKKYTPNKIIFDATPINTTVAVSNVKILTPSSIVKTQLMR